MAGSMKDQEGFLPVATVEVDSARSVSSGFVLEGRGADGATYRLGMHLEMPLDRRTQTVLGEMLVQSVWNISRKSPRLTTKRPKPTRRSVEQ